VRRAPVKVVQFGARDVSENGNLPIESKRVPRVGTVDRLFTEYENRAHIWKRSSRVHAKLTSGPHECDSARCSRALALGAGSLHCGSDVLSDPKDQNDPRQ
jgi:hypothetical protein